MAVAGGRIVRLKPMHLRHACLTSRDRLQLVFWRRSDGAGLGAQRSPMRGRAALGAVRAPSMGQWAVRQCIAKIGNELSRARSMTSSVPRQPRWCHASSSASTQALLRTCCPEVGHDFKRRRSEERHLIDLACSPPCLARRGRGDRRWVTASSSARSRPGTVRKFRS